jgi:hypothetical protein
MRMCDVSKRYQDTKKKTVIREIKAMLIMYDLLSYLPEITPKKTLV